MAKLNFTNYTYPSDDNVSSFGDLFTWANDQVSQGLGMAIVVMTFFFAFLSFKLLKIENRSSLAATSFVCTIIAILLRSIDLVGDLVVGVMIVLTVGCVVWLFKE